uniref:Uncharacterized protein n=1 Tax=Solanum tuberosum TaxID=4113 RepID=M1DW61_SOLTU
MIQALLCRDVKSSAKWEVTMAPKAKNVAGSKQSRKGEAFGSSSGQEPVQKFGKKVVERYGWEWFKCQREVKYMGDEFVNKNVRYSRAAVVDRGRPVTDEEMETLADRYPLIESAAFLCRSGPTFLEPLDDDEATTDEAMDDEEEDDAVNEETNALMVFNGGDDEA